MNKIYIVHCWDGTKDDGWYPWLDNELSNGNNIVYRFNMPNTATPKIEEWVSFLDSQVDSLDDKTYFVGHSIGCQTIMRYLQTKDVCKIGGILFVAPWLDLLDYAIEDEESYNTAKPWLSEKNDFEKVKEFTNNINCIFSDDDYFVSLEQRDKFERLLDANTKVVSGKGHISQDDNVYELKEILDECNKMIEKNKKDYFKDDEYWKENINKSLEEDLWITDYKEYLNGGLCLDLGCGIGQYSKWFMENGYDVISSDISKIALEKVKEFNNNVINLDMREKLPFEDNKFDLVFANLSIHYFSDSDTKNLMSEIKRILKKDGLFIGSVNGLQNLEKMKAKAVELEYHFYDNKGKYMRLFDIDDLKKYLSDFNIIKIDERETVRFDIRKEYLVFIAKKK